MVNVRDLWEMYYKDIGRSGTIATVGRNGRCHVPGGKEYSIHDLARAIEKDPAVKASPYYKAHDHCQIESTMSCDKDEAIGWMRRYMSMALSDGNGSLDINLRAMFLAAYDTYMSLCS